MLVQRKTTIFSLFLTILLIISALTAPASAAESSGVSRMINVVYDDSGSMVRTSGQLVDTWCQAKYAMEVFAALLGNNDTLNIYVMSDFDGRLESPPRLSLKGSDGQNTNVSRIHGMVTTASNTPFNTVRKAYSDLADSSADEKWLVVLTDGEFQGVDNINSFFSQKSPDINVMFLGMGANADEIAADPASGIYFEKAVTSAEILSKITGICTRIFNNDRLDVNVSAKTINFDIPMGELVVFAQGANVTIGSITSSAGKNYLSSMAPVSVQYSEMAATNYPEAIIDRDLNGSILTFRDDFPAGTYTLDVSGANTIEVYYKPNVDVAVYLTDASGKEISDPGSFIEGDYTIDFGFVKGGTNERVAQSLLLGDVSYSATVTQNGVQSDVPYHPGDQIHLESGSLVVDAFAHYLEYNYVSTHSELTVHEKPPDSVNRTVSFSMSNNPKYQVTKDGMDAEQPIQITARLDGRQFTIEEWASAELPTIAVAEEKQGTYGPFTVEKSETPGTFLVYPSLRGRSPSSEIYGDCPFDISVEQMYGIDTWSGIGEGTLHVTDARSWIERNLQIIIRYAAIATVVILLLGYIPPFKKYLPKRLKSRPLIDCSPNRPGVHQSRASGRYTKKFITTILPYKAEEGSIKFVPPGVSGVAVLQVRAAGGSAMLVTNTKSYAGKNDVTFNGAPVPEGAAKPIKLNAGAMICVNTQATTYTCVPSVK